MVQLHRDAHREPPAGKGAVVVNPPNQQLAAQGETAPLLKHPAVGLFQRPSALRIAVPRGVLGVQGGATVQRNDRLAQPPSDLATEVDVFQPVVVVLAESADGQELLASAQQDRGGDRRERCNLVRQKGVRRARSDVIGPQPALRDIPAKPHAHVIDAPSARGDGWLVLLQPHHADSRVGDHVDHGPDHVLGEHDVVVQEQQKVIARQARRPVV